MIYMPPNASVVELPLRPYSDRCFGYMAIVLGLDYWMVPQVSSFIKGNYTMDENTADIITRLVVRILHKHLAPSVNSVHNEDTGSIIEPSKKGIVLTVRYINIRHLFYKMVFIYQPFKLSDDARTFDQQEIQSIEKLFDISIIIASLGALQLIRPHDTCSAPQDIAPYVSNKMLSKDHLRAYAAMKIYTEHYPTNSKV